MNGPGASGRLLLRASRSGSQTVLSDLYRTAPFHPGPLHRRDGIAEIVIQGVGPGIFPGDRLHVDVTVDAGAALAVTGQGATKLYPASAGQHAASETILTVGQNATLWWLPGVVIPFRDANFTSAAMVNLDPGARLVLLEIVTPGRTAMGESFRYARLDLRLRIDVAGTPLLIERALLEPALRPLPVPGRQGAFPCAGTLVLVGFGKPDLAAGNREDILLGADGDERLTMVRGLGRSADALRSALLAVAQSIACTGGGSP